VTAAARLRVDPIACDGRGLCAETLPEMITLDDWGFPIIRAADVPPSLRAAASEAVRLCPLLALRLDRAGRDLAGKMHAMTAGLAIGHSREGCPARH
jgi:ferredoxin